MKLNDGWKEGPLPEVYNWGGVVPVGQKGSGFYFADFCGDHVKYLKIDDSGFEHWYRLEPNEVKYWNNSLMLPFG